MASEPLRVIFFSEAGSPFGRTHFAELCALSGITICGVVTSRREPQSRHIIPGSTRRDKIRNTLWRGIRFITGATPRIDPTVFNMRTDSWIRAIPVLHGRHTRRSAFISRIKALQPDVLISAGHQRILPDILLTIPRVAAVNFHPSLLPEGRGRNPCFWTILTGQKTTGVTAHHMSAGADEGDILLQKSVPLNGEETYTVLYDRLCRLSASMMPEVMALCRSGAPPRIPQPEGQWPMYGEPAEHDYRIDWSNDARSIERLVRAGMDHPGAFTIICGEQVVVCDARVEEASGSQPGAIQWISDHEMRIATGEGRLMIRDMRIQGRIQSAADVARRYALKSGDRLA